MPKPGIGLTKRGEAVKRRFVKRYGAARGNQIFHATINKHPKMAKDLTSKVKSNRRGYGKAAWRYVRQPAKGGRGHRARS